MKHIKPYLADRINQPLITGFQESFSNFQNPKTTHIKSTDKRSNEITMKKEPTKKQKPTVRVTQLAPLMAGEKECEYSVWFPAHHQYEKLPSDSSSLDTWLIEHRELVNFRAAQLKAEGFTVFIEDANSFNIDGTTYKLRISGKADIIAIKCSQVRIEDCKTGKRKASHRMQVLLYMLLYPVAPETKGRFKDLALEGRLVYPDGVVEISSSEVDSQFKELFRKTVARISNLQPVRMAPSCWECTYCNILSVYCPARIDPESGTGDHNLF